MAQPNQQSFRKHARFDPVFHGVGGISILASLVLAVVFIVLHFRTDLILSLWILSISIVAAVALIKARLYPLKAQDRIIRLEERLRLEALLSDPLRKRIPELTEDQLVGLRFASDEELPVLVEMALDKKMSRKQIKERIQHWRPDHYRV